MLRGLVILSLTAMAFGLVAWWGQGWLAGEPTLDGGPTAAPAQSTPQPQQPPATADSISRAAVRPAPEQTPADVPTAQQIAQQTDRLLQRLASAQPPRPTTPDEPIAGFPPPPDQPLSAGQLSDGLEQAGYYADQGDLAAARDLLSELYLNYQLTDQQRSSLLRVLQPLAWQLVTGTHPAARVQTYTVQPGDTLARLAAPYHVPYQLLMRINGISDPRRIRPRQRLRLVQGPFDILIRLGIYELVVLHGGKFVRSFRVGIGKGNTTPLGLFTVNEKLVNPEWPDPDHHRIVPPGDPDNPLGTRWLGIGLGYGIHGTADPASIGRRTSRGCIRMLNEDVELLYDMVVEGSRVLIRP